MTGVLVYSLNAVLPIIIIIILGWLLRRGGMLSDGFLSSGSKLVFRVCLPVLLFYNIYNVDGLGAINWTMIWYSLGMIALIYLLGLAVVLLFVPDGRRRGVVLQCIYRSNYAIIGVPLAEMLGGQDGVALVSIMSAFVVPVFNLLAVVSLSVFIPAENGKAIRPAAIIKNILTNPLIIGVAAGLAALAVRSAVPINAAGELGFSLARDLKFLYKAIESLARIASPLALLVLGGQFVFSAAGRMKKELIIGVVGRVVAAPLIGVGVAAALTAAGVFSFGGADFAGFVALYGTPVAVSSAIMAGQMGSDDQLAGQYVVWTSIFSVPTIFLFVSVLRALGFL